MQGTVSINCHCKASATSAEIFKLIDDAYLRREATWESTFDIFASMPVSKGVVWLKRRSA